MMTRPDLHVQLTCPRCAGDLAWNVAKPTPTKVLAVGKCSECHQEAVFEGRLALVAR